MRSDDILARADEALARLGRPRQTQAATAPHPHVSRSVQVAMVAGALIAFWLLFTKPFALLLVLLGGFGLYALARNARKAVPKAVAEDLPKADLATLPLKSELWLASQRRLLPAAAQSLCDSIGTRLKLLASQIAGIAPHDPVTHDIRRLVAEELPQLVNDYHRVPAALRKQAANGLMPDQQLTLGLITIDKRLDQINTQLAAGPVTQLATQARYLDLKYEDETE